MVEPYCATAGVQVNAEHAPIEIDLENSGGYVVERTELVPRLAAVERIPLLPKQRYARAKNVIEFVASEYDVTVDDVLSHDRHRSIAEARQVCCWLIRMCIEPQLSFPEIARLLGNRDHTTIMSSVRKIDRLRNTDGRMRDVLAQLMQQMPTVYAPGFTVVESGRFG